LKEQAIALISVSNIVRKLYATENRFAKKHQNKKKKERKPFSTSALEFYNEGNPLTNDH